MFGAWEMGGEQEVRIGRRRAPWALSDEVRKWRRQRRRLLTNLRRLGRKEGKQVDGHGHQVVVFSVFTVYCSQLAPRAIAIDSP